MNEKKELVIFETEDNTIKLEVPVEKRNGVAFSVSNDRIVWCR